MAKGMQTLGLLAVAAGGFGVVGNVEAAGSDLLGPSFLVVQENDLVVRTDRHYTQGLKFNFLGREHPGDERDYWGVKWAEYLPDFGLNAQTVRYGLSVGQNIYTPTDISIPTLQVNDRPYAGFLYGEFILQRRGTTANATPELDHWQLDLGILGPPSMAKEAQNTVHQLRHFGLAQGWGNQLSTEPGIAVRYARNWRFSTSGPNGAGGFEAQFIPQVGLSLGNVGTYGAIGGEVRFGYNLPHDFGVHTIDSIMVNSGGKLPGKADPLCGFYLFAGVEGRATAYNEFLDGNLFHASHHVPRHPMVGDGKFGFAFVFRRFDLTYTQVIRTKEFVGQQETDAFGSLAIKIKW